MRNFDYTGSVAGRVAPGHWQEREGDRVRKSVRTNEHRARVLERKRSVVEGRVVPAERIDREQPVTSRSEDKIEAAVMRRRRGNPVSARIESADFDAGNNAGAVRDSSGHVNAARQGEVDVHRRRAVSLEVSRVVVVR